MLGIDAPKENAHKYGLGIRSLEAALSETDAKQFMLVMNSCHSGVLTRNLRSDKEPNLPVPLEHWKKAAIAERNVVFSAVGANENSRGSFAPKAKLV